MDLIQIKTFFMILFFSLTIDQFIYFISGYNQRPRSYITIFSLSNAIGYLVLSYLNPNLARERATSRYNETTKKKDVQLYVPLFMFLPIIISLSAAIESRFYGLSMMESLFDIGDSSVFSGWIILMMSVWYNVLFNGAMLQNNFFSTYIRVQEDRGQFVVTDGFYRIIRHPGYCGNLSMFILGPLVLNSWLCIPFCLGGLVLTRSRILFEENTLKNELKGYTEYCEQVKYKVIPGVW